MCTYKQNIFKYLFVNIFVVRNTLRLPLLPFSSSIVFVLHLFLLSLPLLLHATYIHTCTYLKGSALLWFIGISVTGFRLHVTLLKLPYQLLRVTSIMCEQIKVREMKNECRNGHALLVAQDF